MMPSSTLGFGALHIFRPGDRQQLFGASSQALIPDAYGPHRIFEAARAADGRCDHRYAALNQIVQGRLFLGEGADGVVHDGAAVDLQGSFVDSATSQRSLLPRVL